MDMRSKTVYISVQNIQEIAHTHASASVFLRLKEGGSSMPDWGRYSSGERALARQI